MNFTKSLFYHNTNTLPKQVEKDVLIFLNIYLDKILKFYFEDDLYYFLDQHELPTNVENFQIDKKLLDCCESKYTNSKNYCQKIYQIFEAFLHYVLQFCRKVSIENVIDVLNIKEPPNYGLELFLKPRIITFVRYDLGIYENEYELVGDPQEIIAMANMFISKWFLGFRVKNNAFFVNLHKILSRIALNFKDLYNNVQDLTEEKGEEIMKIYLELYFSNDMKDVFFDVMEGYSNIEYTMAIFEQEGFPKHLKIIRKLIAFFCDTIICDVRRYKNPNFRFLNMFFFQKIPHFTKVPFLFDQETIMNTLVSFRDQELERRKSLEISD